RGTPAFVVPAQACAETARGDARQRAAVVQFHGVGVQMVGVRHAEGGGTAAAAIQAATDVVGEQAQVPAAAGVVGQVHDGLGLGASEHRAGLGPQPHRDAVLAHAGVGQVDEVVE